MLLTQKQKNLLQRENQKNKGLPPKHDNRHRNLSKEEVKEKIETHASHYMDSWDLNDNE